MEIVKKFRRYSGRGLQVGLHAGRGRAPLPPNRVQFLLINIENPSTYLTREPLRFQQSYTEALELRQQRQKSFNAWEILPKR